MEGFYFCPILSLIGSGEIQSLFALFSLTSDYSDALAMFSAFSDIFGCMFYSYFLPLLRVLLLWRKLMEVMETLIHEFSSESCLLQC